MNKRRKALKASADQNSGIMLTPTYPRAVGKPFRKSTGPRIVRVWGSSKKEFPVNNTKPKILPNPWPPADIETLVTLVGTTAGIATAAYRLVKLWVDDRGARRIKIKKGDAEIEIQGGMGVKEIDRAFGHFRKLTKGKKGKIIVTLPRGADRSLPSERDRPKKASKKGGKSNF